MIRWNRAVVVMAVLGLTPVAGLNAQKAVKPLSESDLAAIKALNVSASASSSRLDPPSGSLALTS